MADDIPKRISYKSQISPHVISRFGNYPIGRTVNEEKPYKFLSDDLVTTRTEGYEITTATNAAAQLTNWTAQIGDNHKSIELGMRYHENAAFAKTFDAYAKCRNMFGGRVKTPSLPSLLDLQEKTLGNYAACLDQIAHYVDSQQRIIKNEVNMMEKQLGNHNLPQVQDHIVKLRSELGEAKTHSERRTIIEQLYEQDRFSRNISHSQDFFNQYITQESTLRDVAHSLHLLTDQTVLFETYLSTSKGFFVSVNGIGQVVSHMSPIVDKMKTETVQLQDNVQVVTGYLAQKSTDPLFSRESMIALARG